MFLGIVVYLSYGFFLATLAHCRNIFVRAKIANGRNVRLRHQFLAFPDFSHLGFDLKCLALIKCDVLSLGQRKRRIIFLGSHVTGQSDSAAACGVSDLILESGPGQ